MKGREAVIIPAVPPKLAHQRPLDISNVDETTVTTLISLLQTKKVSSYVYQ